MCIRDRRTITSGRATSSMVYSHHAQVSNSIAKAVLEEAVSYTHLDVYKRQKVDRLEGMKENVICGHLIPAGTRCV